MGLVEASAAKLGGGKLCGYCTDKNTAIFKISPAQLIVLLGLLFSIHAQALKLEADTVVLPATDTYNLWTQVTFKQVYDTIPAVFSINTEENPDPVVVRIKNVTQTGFEMAQFEPDNEDGAAVEMTVAYMAIEEGVHVLPGGAQLEVGKITTDLSQGNKSTGPKGWETITWLASYTGTPGILTKLQTFNTGGSTAPGSVLIPFMAVAIDSASSTQADITIERAETAGSHIAETIAYMAIENGKKGQMYSDGAPGTLYETMVTSRSVKGWSNGCYGFNFLNTYTQTPFLVGAQNDRGGNNGGFLRLCSISLTQAGFAIDEDRANDTERSHTTEIVAALIFEEPFYFNSAESTCSGTHAESWDSGTYTSQEGSENWSSDWVETGDDASASSGSIRIDSGDLLFTGASDGSASKSITRQFNLANYDESYFSYSFEKVGTLDADDDVLVEVSGNGGTSWNLLYTIEGSNTNLTGLISHDITAYISANTQIRFTFSDASGTGCCFEGAKGIRIKKVDISSAADDCTNAIDHFDISHDGQGLTCDVESVTVRAVDLGGIRVFDYVQAIDLATSTGEGDWSIISGGGILTPGAANSGTASYLYDPSDAGVAELGLSHLKAGTVNVNVVDANLFTETTGSATAANDQNIEYVSAGFRVVDAMDNAIPSSMIAGTSAGAGLSGLYLQAVATDATTKTCEGYFKDTTTVDVELGTRCIDPGSCISGQQVTVINNLVSTVLPNPQNLVLGQDKVPVSLLFGPDSKAPISLLYPDVGRIALDAKLDVSSNSTMTGTAQTVSKPADLMIQSIQSGATANPGSSSSAGAKFIAAGDTFTVQVRVENTNGDLTPNFGNETSPENIEFTRSHLAPTGGTFTNGSLSQSSDMNISNGLLSFSGVNGLSYSEVGAISLTAKIKNGQYLDQGDVTATASPTIGRFYPKYLVVTSATNGSWQDSCNTNTAYVYAGDSLAYDVAPNMIISARNNSNSTTINYQGAWAKLIGSAFTPVIQSTNTAGLNITHTMNDGTISSNNNGTVTYTLSNSDRLTVDHTSETAFEPANLPVTLSYSQIQDSDGVAVADLSVAKVTPSGSQVRFGRMKLDSAVGPDNLNLKIGIRPEYYSAGAFITNIDDSCTAYSSGNLLQTPANATGDQGNGTFNLGEVVTKMELTATNTFIEIPYTYSLTAYPYLRYDWDSDGSNDDDPSGKAAFGLYEGRKPIIYQWQVIGQ